MFIHLSKRCGLALIKAERELLELPEGVVKN